LSHDKNESKVGSWIGNRIYCTLGYSDYALHFTITHTHTHTLVSTVMSSLPLLGSGFQWRTFPFFWVPEISPASATRFSQLTTTDSLRVRGRFTLRLAVYSQSVCPDDRPLETHDQRFFTTETLRP
jgi:hypothetical protein